MKKQVAMSLVFSFLTLSLSASEDALGALAIAFSSDDTISVEPKNISAKVVVTKKKKMRTRLDDVFCVSCCGVVFKYKKDIPSRYSDKVKVIDYYLCCCGLVGGSFDELSCSLLCGLAKFCSDKQDITIGEESRSLCDIGCGCCVVGLGKPDSCCYGVAKCREGQNDFTDDCDTVCNCFCGLCVWGDKKPSSCCGISCSEGENAEPKTGKTTGLVTTV